MRDTFIKTLTECVETQKNIFLITGDLGFGVLTEFAKNYPKNFLNAGVAEQNMTGVAAGMAMEGRILFTYSIGNFSTLRCLEQIRNDVCYHDANVKIVSVGGGFSYGALGFSHHATEDVAILRSIPGLTVVVPGTKWEVEQATKAIIQYHGPCYLRLDKSSAEDSGTKIFQLGKARIFREGTDVTLVTMGGILSEVQKAAERVKESHGISCAIINAHTIKPFDPALIVNQARSSTRVITIEEHVIDGGLGSLVAESLADANVQLSHFKRLGLTNCFPTVVGDQQYLRSIYKMDVNEITSSILRAMNK